MVNWQKGPLNEALCKVYEGKMLMCIYPEGLVIGTMLSYEFKHRAVFCITNTKHSYSVNDILAYKVMDP